METLAKYLTSLESVKKYLSYCKSIQIEYTSKLKMSEFGKYSKEYTSQMFKNKDDFKALHKIIMENRDYDIILNSVNFFQFYCEQRQGKLIKICLCYMSNPKSVINIDEFARELHLDYDDPNLIRDYTEYVIQEPYKENIEYVRYDFDPSLYKNMKHSASHLHIGIKNEIRIPLNSILTPLAFVDLIIRNVYKDDWEEAKKEKIFKEKFMYIKDECKKLPRAFYSDEDAKLLTFI